MYYFYFAHPSKYETLSLFYEIDTSDNILNSKISSEIYSKIASELSSGDLEYEITIRNGSIVVEVILAAFISGAVSAVAASIINKILNKKEPEVKVLVVTDEKHIQDTLLKIIKNPNCMVSDSKTKIAKSYIEKFSKFREKFSFKKKNVKKVAKKKFAKKKNRSTKKKKTDYVS